MIPVISRKKPQIKSVIIVLPVRIRYSCLFSRARCFMPGVGLFLIGGDHPPPPVGQKAVRRFIKTVAIDKRKIYCISVTRGHNIYNGSDMSEIDEKPSKSLYVYRRSLIANRETRKAII